MTNSADIALGPPRGMRDFYPEDMIVREAIFNAWKSSARRFGFQSYDACVVESLDLLKRKAGEEIADQIYAFQDKSGRDLALRAEMTPTLARMVAARQGNLQFPLKWYTIAQCFRYERMSKGRKREHYQWNMDIVGENSLSAEVEVIGAAVNALESLGLTRQQFRVHVNNRALLGDILASIGVPPASYATVFLVLDKRGKISDDEMRTMLASAGLVGEIPDKLFSLFRCTTLAELEPLLKTQTPAWIAMHDFLDLVNAANLSDVVVFDLSVIRGLSYYTGMVFECFDTNKEFRAIFGGGRYDNLLSDIGGKSMSAVGLGFGDVVVAELLEAKSVAPSITNGTMVAVGFMEEAQRIPAMKFAQSLRATGQSVDLALKPEKAKMFFSRSGGNSAFLEAAFIGPDDISSGTVRMKNLKDRSQREIRL